jgi:plastocyanin
MAYWVAGTTYGSQATHITGVDMHPSLTPHLPWIKGGTQAAHTTGSISYQPHKPWPATGTVLGTGMGQPTSTVVVGDEGKLVFSPSSLNASIGTHVEFNFLGLNHTLTQSEFQDPCQGSGSFDSGFKQFNPSNISGKFVVEYTVTSNDPEWFFCAQTAKRAHCQAGMVFSLNPRGLYPQFLSNALAAMPPTSSQPSACQLPTSSILPTNSSALQLATGTGTSSVVIGPTSVSPVISNLGNGVAANGMLFCVVVLLLGML